MPIRWITPATVLAAALSLGTVSIGTVSLGAVSLSTVAKADAATSSTVTAVNTAAGATPPGVGAPAMTTVAGGQLWWSDVFELDTTGNVVLRNVCEGRVGPRQTIPAQGRGGVAAAADQSRGGPEIVATRNPSGHVIIRLRAQPSQESCGNPNPWTGWLDLGGSASSIPAVASLARTIHVAVRDAQGRLIHRSRTPSGTWSPWAVVSAAGQIAAAPAMDEHGTLAVKRADGRVYLARLENSSYRSFRALPALPGGVGIASHPTLGGGDNFAASPDVAVIGSNSQLYLYDYTYRQGAPTLLPTRPLSADGADTQAWFGPFGETQRWGIARAKDSRQLLFSSTLDSTGGVDPLAPIDG